MEKDPENLISMKKNTVQISLKKQINKNKLEKVK